MPPGPSPAALLLKCYLHERFFILRSDCVTLLTEATLGDATEIEMILLVSCHLRWPRQVGVAQGILTEEEGSIQLASLY